MQKTVNKFTALRNQQKPNKYSKEAAGKRAKKALLKKEEYEAKRKQKEDQKATKVSLIIFSIY